MLCTTVCSDSDSDFTTGNHVLCQLHWLVHAHRVFEIFLHDMPLASHKLLFLVVLSQLAPQQHRTSTQLEFVCNTRSHCHLMTTQNKLLLIEECFARPISLFVISLLSLGSAVTSCRFNHFLTGQTGDLYFVCQPEVLRGHNNQQLWYTWDFGF